MLPKKFTCVITGSDKGIGKAVLNLLSRPGANIFACTRKKDDNFLKYIDLLNKKYDCKIENVIFDLNDKEEIKKGLEFIRKKTDSIDFLVNNASEIHTSILQMTPIKVFNKIFEVNFFNQVFFTQEILKKIVKSNYGSIVFVSSTSAEDCTPGRVVYSSSKASINALVKTLSKELGKVNIRVNAVAPGLTDTRMAKENTPDEEIEKYLQNTSLKRIGKPEEIANLIEFLLSEKSSYITGQIIRIDGGL